MAVTISTEISSEKAWGGKDYVRESRFGRWFLGTETWLNYVVRLAIDDLERLVGNRRPRRPTILDVGCGWGYGLQLLADRFAPERLIGVDIDPQMIAASARRARTGDFSVDLRHGSAARLPAADDSIDLLFCHQTFHHFVDQPRAIREFHRVLRPGGLLLFAESTRAYIHSLPIRLLFRHPMEVQKTAAEYLALVRESGFGVPDASVSYPYLWWSRLDLGLAENLFGIAPLPGHEETLINLVAEKNPGR